MRRGLDAVAAAKARCHALNGRVGKKCPIAVSISSSLHNLETEQVMNSFALENSNAWHADGASIW